MFIGTHQSHRTEQCIGEDIVISFRINVSTYQPIEIIERFWFMLISGKTKIVGIFGYPIEHTLSPLMHNAAFNKLNLDYIYLPFSVEPSELKKAVESLRSLNITGVNITIPHKEKVMKYLDEIDKDACLIGAVNTINNVNGLLKGYNTDGEGFISSLLNEARLKLAGKRVLLIGAGGVGKAIAIKLAEKSVERIVITDKIIEKARKLVRHVVNNISDCYAYSVDFNETKVADEISEADILVNATPLGMHKTDPYVVNPKLLRKDLFVYDVIYNRNTELLNTAKKVGAKNLSGLGMLLYQGAISFEIWTGKKAPIYTMRRVISDKFRER